MKIILSTDWHFGMHNNSVRHSEDLLEYTDFLISYAKDNNINKLAHLGDYFHQRDKLDINTIHHGTEAVRRLNEHFGQFPMLKGNHDLYFRDKRDVSSVSIFEEYVQLIDSYEIIDDVMYVSWVCNQEEYDEIINVSKKNKIKYIAGHFEFSQFSMNDHYVMDHGSSHKELKHAKWVFSGHYHMRQERDNVVYIGNPFPFDMNDANDLERGFCVLDTDTGEYEFVNYEKIAVLSMSPEELLETDWNDTNEDLTVRVVITDDIDDETMDAIKEQLESKGFRNTKIVYKPNNSANDLVQENTEIGELMSIDEAVVTHIKNMTDVENVDKKMLLDIYKGVINE